MWETLASRQTEPRRSELERHRFWSRPKNIFSLTRRSPGFYSGTKFDRNWLGRHQHRLISRALSVKKKKKRKRPKEEVPDGNLNTCVVGRSLPNHRRSSGRHHVDPLLVRTGHPHRRILASKETFFLHVQPLPTFITLLYHRSSCLSTQPPDLARGRGFQTIDSISPREYQQLSIRGMSLGCHQASSTSLFVHDTRPCHLNIHAITVRFIYLEHSCSDNRAPEART